jgi:biopolymer transport protein ExbB
MFNLPKPVQKLAWAVAAFFAISTSVQAEWNADWPTKNKININAAAITEPASQVPVLVRLHSGNFDFSGVNIDGSDLRFIASDDKTELKYYVEKFDAVNELAVVWVLMPSLNAANKDAHIWVYSGNEKAPSNSNAKLVSDANTVAKFQFSEKAFLQDSSNTGLVASGAVTPQKAGLIGESATFNGTALTIPANPAITATGGHTWSAWVKPSVLPQSAKLYSQGDVLSLAIDAQTLKLNVAGVELAGGELKPAAWQHVAFTLNAGKAAVYVNGVEVATGEVSAVDVASDILIGDAFAGEMDEIEIAKSARSAGWLKLAATSQGVDSKLLTVVAGEGGEEEDEGEANYIGILVNSLTLDAKIVIGILAVMFAISVWVMWTKFSLVTKTDKDNQKFLARFQKAGSADLLQLDKGGNYKESNLFMLYMAGLREIKKREHDGQLSLSGASMDAIKAAIDAELVRETQRQNSGIVLLTIAISGGPFLGLLGTVVGVMITFAAIAAAGDVNVNAIAPGIAAALLATVAGLGVAIPALFAYNYLASRIKNITIAMQIFVDEFVTRTAELYGKE